MTGIYKITNKVTGDFYIGGSVNAKGRKSNHFNRDARKYYGRYRLHTDIVNYGKENFSFEVIEECKREELLEREQYWYDVLKPTYNVVRPAKHNFVHAEVLRKARAAQNTKAYKEKMKKIHASKSFRIKCKMIHVSGKRRMKPVRLIDRNLEFMSLSDAGRWVKGNTQFTSVNPTSKIKAVCDGERNTAYGFQWEYLNL